MKPYKHEVETEYRENNGNFCPFCGSSDISAGHTDFEGLTAQRSVECKDCGREWIEGFKMVEVVFSSDDVRFIEEETEFDNDVQK